MIKSVFVNSDQMGVEMEIYFQVFTFIFDFNCICSSSEDYSLPDKPEYRGKLCIYDGFW